MKFTLLICSIAVMLSYSCKAGKKSMKDTVPLYNTKWLLKKIHNGDSIENVNTKAFIRFDKVKGSAGGNGSCNSFGSNATISGDEVHFKNIFSTKIYCEDVQKTENSFLKQLEKVNRIEIKDKTLLLYEDRKILLEFLTEP